MYVLLVHPSHSSLAHITYSVDSRDKVLSWSYHALLVWEHMYTYLVGDLRSLMKTMRSNWTFRFIRTSYRQMFWMIASLVLSYIKTWKQIIHIISVIQWHPLETDTVDTNLPVHYVLQAWITILWHKTLQCVASAIHHRFSQCNGLYGFYPRVPGVTFKCQITNFKPKTLLYFH